MIRAVLFDLDRTLLDRDTSFLKFVESQYARFQNALAPLSREKYVSRVVALDDRGSLWKDKVYQAIVEEFSIRDLSWRDLFEDFDARIADYYVPFPHLREMLEALKTDYALGLVSNGRTEFQLRSLRALAIEEDFDAILISEAAGLRKPDPRIFRQALRELKCEPPQAVYVGDHPVVDIGGASSAGLRTIWKRDRDGLECPKADAVFDDLAEIPALVRSL